MKIGGFLPLSLSDFPSTPAAVVFTQGCNWRCSFCHNSHLLPLGGTCEMEDSDILDYLKKRVKRLDAVVISGGEPTLQPDLEVFIEALKQLDIRIKLDTNGTRPAILQALISGGNIDYFAMDIKSPWENYSSIVGKTVYKEDILQSINRIASSGIPHHFRTTQVPELITDEDLEIIKSYIPSNSHHITQPYVPPVIS